MAAWAARPSGVHIRAAGTTEIPVRSEVSCDQAEHTWNESGTPPAGVHRLSNPSPAASRATDRSWSNGRPSLASSPTPMIMIGSMPDAPHGARDRVLTRRNPQMPPIGAVTRR